jgi:hypothetical protein
MHCALFCGAVVGALGRFVENYWLLFIDGRFGCVCYR